MPIFPTYEIAKWNSQITWLTHHLPVTSRMELNLRRSARWSHGDGFCLVHFLFSMSFRNKSIQSRSNFIFYSLDRYLPFLYLDNIPCNYSQISIFLPSLHESKFRQLEVMLSIRYNLHSSTILIKINGRFHFLTNQTLNKYVI